MQNNYLQILTNKVEAKYVRRTAEAVVSELFCKQKVVSPSDYFLPTHSLNLSKGL
jgi:hypothetical protein